MSTYLGTQLLSGVGTNTIANAHSLFDFKWTDHILNEMSWLRSDTFSWHNGDVYVAAYNHLEADITEITPTSETIGSYTITYYPSTDGHKVVLSNMESIVQSIYNETGIAWYYIIDTTNKRFKLPRTKFGFVGYRDGVGNYVQPGLPNIVGEVRGSLTNTSGETGGSGALSSSYVIGDQSFGFTSGQHYIIKEKIDASESNSIYGNSTTVQAPATQMYLYFYVGDYDVSHVTQDALDGKANTTMDNLTIEGKNIANWSNNVSNCITEIPQDINVELNDGTLTLKAGSKVYINNGNGYEPLILSNDAITDWDGSTDSRLITVYDNGTLGVYIQGSNATSGTTPPNIFSGTVDYLWYDTNTNIIKVSHDTQVSWTPCSLPICLSSSTINVGIVRIDKVFNGFGYIGSKVFALPGVKGIIANGKNSDGTLNSIPFAIENVIINGTAAEFINAINSYAVIEYENNQLTLQRTSASETYYDENENCFRRPNDELHKYCCVVGMANSGTAGITYWEPKPVYHSVDYGNNDFVVSYKKPTAEDPRWYRLYKSGWIEQGGYVTGASSFTINFIIPFANTLYNLTWTREATGSGPYGYGNKTTESCKLYLSSSGGGDWEAKGYIR